MLASELRLALAIAQDRTVDLSAEFHNPILYGFGLPDFEPVTVSLRIVAACIRWQCNCFDGSFDWKQFNADRPHYLRQRIQIADLHDAEATRWLVAFVQSRMHLDQAA